MNNIVMMPVSAIIPYENNPRKNKEAVERVAASLREFGFRQPIVVDKDYVIVAGHTRLLAAKRLRMKEVPVLVADDLSEEQIKAYRLADNKTAEFSEWDEDLLKVELSDLLDLDFDMEQFGFDLDLDENEDDQDEDEVDEGDIDEDEVERRVYRGDVWQLGTHRLICGDCGDVNVLDKLTEGERVDLLLTDPPYGIGADKGIKTTYGTNAHNAYNYEEHGGWDNAVPDKDVFDLLLSMTDKAVIFGANYFIDKLPVANGAWIVWDKVGEIEFQNPFSDCELAWTNLDRNIVKKYTCIQQGFVNEERGEKRVHPTQKPVKMLAEVLKDVSEEGDTVLDAFGGSGSTMMACEQTGRVCLMCEKDEHYCDVIIQRWENLTGSTAERIAENEEN